jgi:hypothetical protein
MSVRGTFPDTSQMHYCYPYLLAAFRMFPTPFRGMRVSYIVLYHLLIDCSIIQRRCLNCRGEMRLEDDHEW